MGVMKLESVTKHQVSSPEIFLVRWSIFRWDTEVLATTYLTRAL